MWSVDGFVWNVPCTIERVSEVKSSDISGMLLDKTYFNDVLGTWLKYTIALAIPKGEEGEYSALYEVLSSPDDGHVFVLPYNQSQVSITARVETISDKYVRLPNNKNTWRYTKFDIIANHPSKEKDVDDVITTGLTPTPEAPSASAGDLYEYSSSGVWVQRFYDDADDTYY